MLQKCCNCKAVVLQINSLNKNSNVTKFIKVLQEITLRDISNSVSLCWFIKEKKEHSVCM